MKQFVSLIAVISTLTLSPAALAAEQCDVEVKVNGMVCDFCARALEKVFGEREEVQDIKVDLDNSSIHIVMEEGETLDDATLRQLITDSGYAINAIDREC